MVMDLHKIIEQRREAIGMTKYDLVQKVLKDAPEGETVSERSLYRFLAGETEIRSKALGLLFDALGLKVKP